MATTRIMSIDSIRVLAMLLVIVLHTLLSFTLRVDFFGTKLWFLLEPIVALSKTSVLLFFLISGYLVLTKNRSIKDNWSKIRAVILLPFFTFTLIDIGLLLRTAIRTGAYIPEFWQTQVLRLLSFPSSSLWFLVVLFFLYLFNPVWQTMFAEKGKKMYARYTALLFLLLFVAMTLIKAMGVTDPSGSILTGWLGFVFFYLYGGLVRNTWINFQNKWVNILILIGGFALTIIGDYATLSTQFHTGNTQLSATISTLISIPVACMAVGIFNLLVGSDFSWLTKNMFGKTLPTHLATLAQLSYGVYLLHPLVVALLPEFGFTFDHLSLNVYLYNILNYSLVLSSSIGATYLLSKIPKVRSLIGMA